ncbi:MAG: DUF5719 family protein [Acidimicrobiia bacterium]
MRRAIGAALIALVAVTALLLPRPDEPEGSAAGPVDELPFLEPSAIAGVWYCPWGQASATRDSFVAVASVEQATAEFTFPVPVPGEPGDTARLELIGPGAGGLDLTQVALRGEAPGFVEFSGGPAAASVAVGSDEFLAADTCVSSGPKIWHLPGGSTREGQQLRLRLFNPFPEDAKVTVTVVSEIAFEPLSDLRGIEVPGRSWRDVDFEERLRLRESLALTVTSDEGLILPAMSLVNGVDEAWWPGVGLSETWEFPVVRHRGLKPTLAVDNPGDLPVTVTIDVFTPTGGIADARTVEILAAGPARIPLEDLEGDQMAIRVRASGPISAAVVAEGSKGLAATIGAPRPDLRWLLPGVRSVGQTSGFLWVLNSSDEVIAVTLTPLGGEQLEGEKISIQPGTVRVVEVTRDDAVGYLAASLQPFTAAWSADGPQGVAFSLGAGLGQ